MCSDSLYNFSGILYRMGIVCSVLVLLGIVCILLERMPAKKWKKRADKMGWIMIAGSILLALFYASSIVFPDVSAYTGEFVGRHGNGKGFMIKEYVFWTGEGTKKVLSMDIFSKQEIYPQEFVEGKEYRVYFDERTRIVVGVESIE